MSIPDKAVEAYVDAYMTEVLSRVDTAGLPSEAAVRAGLEAAEPYLTAADPKTIAALAEARTTLREMIQFVKTETPDAVGTLAELRRVHRVVFVAVAAHPEVKS